VLENDWEFSNGVGGEKMERSISSTLPTRKTQYLDHLIGPVVFILVLISGTKVSIGQLFQNRAPRLKTVEPNRVI
jgi:hypothetical protein